MSISQGCVETNDLRLPPILPHPPPPVPLPSISGHLPPAPYIPSPYNDYLVPSRATRAQFLNPSVQGMPITWLKLLKLTFCATRVTLPPWRLLYPLTHHQELIQNWKSLNPGQLYPAEKRWGLITLGGSVEDDCHPPPPYSLPILIIAALNGSPSGKLTGQEIRLALMIRYNFFITQSRSWHEEVYFTLASNPRYFRPIERKFTSEDTGCHWSLRIVVSDSAHSSSNFYLPLQPVEPKISRPQDAPYSSDSMPQAFDVDVTKGSGSPIPREARDELMRLQGRSLIDRHLGK